MLLLIFIICFLFNTFNTIDIYAQEPFFAAPGQTLIQSQSQAEAEAEAQSQTESQSKQNLVNRDKIGLFRFYKQYISPADGNRCGMYPSCSSYGQEAVKKHGLFIGWIMTCDRLIRCGRDETKLSQSISSSNKLLTVDPVAANDFWWYSHDASK